MGKNTAASWVRDASFTQLDFFLIILTNQYLTIIGVDFDVVSARGNSTTFPVSDFDEAISVDDFVPLPWSLTRMLRSPKHLFGTSKAIDHRFSFNAIPVYTRPF